MIQVHNLKKKFDDFQALNGVEMHVGKGDIYGLVGPNGAGKSTLIRHLTGVYKADEGEILIDGEPVFEKLSANLGKAILSIGAVKAFEIGDGTAVAHALGHTNNDQYTRDPDGKIIKLTNHSGGILGGISDGSDIFLRVSVKPTPSISREQSTITKDGGSRQISVKGRHDPVIVPRAVVVVESMAAITLVDMLMCSITSNMTNLERFFRK